MKLTIEIDPATVAAMVNEAMAEEAETPESVERWIDQNDTALRALLTQAIAETLIEV